jgi:hypothetical protein
MLNAGGTPELPVELFKLHVRLLNENAGSVGDSDVKARMRTATVL